MNTFETMLRAVLDWGDLLIRYLMKWLRQPAAWIVILLAAALIAVLIAYIRMRMEINSKKKRGKKKKKTLDGMDARARFRLLMTGDVTAADDMEGHDFEKFCADLLRRNGFDEVRVTPASGDQGVDILAQKDDIRYAIQCKNYNSKLGNTPVQEIYAGKTFYHCHVGVVMTNSTFTQGAIDLAEATNVLLWDRDRLQRFMQGE